MSSWPVAAKLWNMYGPTETTVWSTCWKVDLAALDAISIGRPIANTNVHVLDANLQPVPIGAAGELFIGGSRACRRICEPAGSDRPAAFSMTRCMPDREGGCTEPAIVPVGATTARWSTWVGSILRSRSAVTG